MNRRRFFGSFAAIGAIPAVAAAKALQDEAAPSISSSNGEHVIRGNVRIEGAVSIIYPKSEKYGLRIQGDGTAGLIS